MKQSMDKMSLGDRMKKYYEGAHKITLPQRMPVIIRVDGRAFHTLTRGFNKPYDMKLIKLMQETALYMCENIQNAVLGYVQSDEISILLHNYKRLSSQSWFGNELQKIVSISASLASSFFSVNSSDLFLEESGTNLIFKPIQFDSRAFVLPETEVCNYFIWRQQDWERNSIQMLGQANFSHKELQNKSNKDIQEMCFTQKNINWNDLPIYIKRGTSIIYKDSEWCLDKEMPILTKDREYVEKLLEVEED
jgi:tRNA(His) guanylyltransferase